MRTYLPNGWRNASVRGFTPKSMGKYSSADRLRLPSSRPLGRTLLFATSFVVFCLAGTVRPDEVLTIDSRGKELRRTGTIKDLKGDQLTIQTSSGREVSIALNRVKQLVAEWLPSHQDADAKYAVRDYESALSLYREAFNDEQRRWVKRKLLARVVWCLRNTGRNGEACQMFARLAKDDEETPYFGAIPLPWQMKQCPNDVRAVVRDWLAIESAPAKRLMAASWLMVHQRSASISTLRGLGKNPSKKISGLAIAQLWRAEMLTLKEPRIAWWSSQIDEIPRELRAGPYYLLGQSYARFDRVDEAALAFLRVPSSYAENVLLAQESLWEAAKGLQKNDQTQEAIVLYRQIIELGASTELGRRAAQSLVALEE